MDLCHLFVRSILGQELIKNATTATLMNNLKSKTTSSNKFQRIRNCALNAKQKTRIKK